MVQKNPIQQEMFAGAAAFQQQHAQMANEKSGGANFKASHLNTNPDGQQIIGGTP